jgi:hypothetical protein
LRFEDAGRGNGDEENGPSSPKAGRRVGVGFRTCPDSGSVDSMRDWDNVLLGEKSILCAELLGREAAGVLRSMGCGGRVSKETGEPAAAEGMWKTRRQTRGSMEKERRRLAGGGHQVNCETTGQSRTRSWKTSRRGCGLVSVMKLGPSSEPAPEFTTHSSLAICLLQHPLKCRVLCVSQLSRLRICLHFCSPHFAIHILKFVFFCHMRSPASVHEHNYHTYDIHCLLSLT